MAGFTKRAIIDSFKKLLNQYPLDKITVKEIVDDCGVNRNTFYYYFHDIFALLDELFREETSKVIERPDSFNSWQDSFLNSMEFVIENKKAVYHIYNSINKDKLEPYIYSIIETLMIGFVKEQAKGLTVKDEDIKFIADFYKYALVGYIFDWIRNGLKDDPKYMINKLGHLFEGNIKYMLTNQ